MASIPNFAGMIEMIEKASGGQVSGELVFGLAPPPAQMDLIQDGVADIAIIFHGYQRSLCGNKAYRTSRI